MDTSDEIPLEDHRYFRARLDHLETRNPAALLNHLEQETLTKNLRNVTGRAMQTQADLVINKNMPVDQADELVMNQIVADPAEQSRLDDPASRIKLRTLLDRYKATLSDLPRTYQSESETTE
ncbi:MAG TPA: hypothetical protein VHD56_17430 [Tepidisphaeraceae bacterium]|jgi:hypothetical protein|nr:hypothetical protein [Tepidisphaeraceae bacterium]